MTIEEVINIFDIERNLLDAYQEYGFIDYQEKGDNLYLDKEDIKIIASLRGSNFAKYWIKEYANNKPDILANFRKLNPLRSVKNYKEAYENMLAHKLVKVFPAEFSTGNVFYLRNNNGKYSINSEVYYLKIESKEIHDPVLDELDGFDYIDQGIINDLWEGAGTVGCVSQKNTDHAYKISYVKEMIEIIKKKTKIDSDYWVLTNDFNITESDVNAKIHKTNLIEKGKILIGTNNKKFPGFVFMPYCLSINNEMENKKEAWFAQRMLWEGSKCFGRITLT